MGDDKIRVAGLSAMCYTLLSFGVKILTVSFVL